MLPESRSIQSNSLKKVPNSLCDIRPVPGTAKRFISQVLADVTLSGRIVFGRKVEWTSVRS